MPAPYDYSSGLTNPVASFLGSLKMLQEMEKQQAAQRQAEQRQRIMESLMRPGTTVQDYARATLALPEDREAFKQSWDMMDAGKRDAIFKGGSEAYMLAENDPEGAVTRLEEYATGFENAGDDEAAKQFRDAAQIVKRNPQAARATIGMMLSFADGERFQKVAGAADPTTFQKDFSFIKETFGEEAAAEFAQYGRGGIVSIPLGNGQTYVGPASMAPGSTRWREQTGESGGADTAPKGVPEIMGDAKERGFITQAEVQALEQLLPNTGRGQFKAWREANGIKVVTRTGRSPDGRKIIQYEDGSWEYGE